LSTTVTKLAINQFGVKNIQNVHCRDTKECCRDDATAAAAQWRSCGASDGHT